MNGEMTVGDLVSLPSSAYIKLDIIYDNKVIVESYKIN